MKRLYKIRAQLKKLKDSNNFFGKVFFKIIYFCWATFKFIIKPRYRSEQISRILYFKQIIQVSTFTKENRYPVLFNQIAKELKDLENPKILSYGCSTGEEVLSLKQLMPNAEITGIDINPWCIKTAKEKNPYSDCYFIHSSNKSWKLEEYYDCIVALAVFQKTVHRDHDRKISTDTFGFVTFERELTSLLKFLNLKGLFILDHSDYQFTDINIFEKQFQSIFNKPIKRSRPVYSKSNMKASDISISNRIFQKIT